MCEFHLCFLNLIELLRYDFNKPCKGKDQRNTESATLESLMTSYVDAGFDIITAEDVFTALHYGNDLKHSQVCAAEISEEDTILQGKGIKKFSDFHSVSFKKDHMILHQYYDISSGIIKPYGNVNFIPAITEVKPFSACSQNMDFIPSTKKKGQNWSLFNLLFCSDIGCDQVFKNVEDPETHLTEDCEKTGDNDAPRSSMDNVESLIASKMVYSPHKHVTLSNNQVCLAETNINEAYEKYPLLRMFQKPGSAIPYRKVFK